MPELVKASTCVGRHALAPDSLPLASPDHWRKRRSGRLGTGSLGSVDPHERIIAMSDLLQQFFLRSDAAFREEVERFYPDGREPRIKIHLPEMSAIPDPSSPPHTPRTHTPTPYPNQP